MQDILVVPDTHARPFWKTVLKSDLPVVFLGDHLDPYEKISFDIIISELKEIMDFAKEKPDDVTLLLGDHEGQYVGLSTSWARFDLKHAEEIYNLLKENESLFTGAFIYNDALFTHAGVTKNWLDNNKLEENFETIKDYINRHITFSNELLIPDYRNSGFSQSCIWDIGASRGGYALYGGPFWADVSEFWYGTPAFNGQINQIFAHSQLKDTGACIHKDNWWMCDSRAVFIWNGKELKQYK